MLELERGQVLELVQVPAQVLELERGQVPELAQVPAQALEPGLAPVLHRQRGSQLATMPAGLIIFSFSSIKIPPFRFWSAKDLLFY